MKQKNTSEKVMKPKLSPLQVLMTTDYSIFNILKENRDVRKSRVTKIMNSISEINFTRCQPIVLNEKMEIIDGQTRFFACKELGLPIYYMIEKLNGQSVKVMTSMNTKQAKWNQDEFIDLYYKQGHPVFIETKECMEKYPFITSSTALYFVTNQPNLRDIKTGDPATIKKGKIPYSTFGDILVDFKEIFKDYNHVFFIRALINVVKLNLYNHKDDFKRFEKHRYQLKGCSDINQYLQMFEEILNYHRRGGKIDVITEYNKSKKLKK